MTVLERWHALILLILLLFLYNHSFIYFFSFISFFFFSFYIFFLMILAEDREGNSILLDRVDGQIE